LYLWYLFYVMFSYLFQLFVLVCSLDALRNTLSPAPCCILSPVPYSALIQLYAVLLIRDVYPGSRILLFYILYPGFNFFHPGSRIHIKEFKYFTPKKFCFNLSDTMIRVVHPGSGP
jgi:hypothetical protein